MHTGFIYRKYVERFVWGGVFLLLSSHVLLAQSEVSIDTLRIMSYNVENLFDCAHDSLKNDTEFLPDAVRHWTYSKYKQKLIRLSKVVAAVGGERTPDIVGLCEVENDKVLRDFTRYSPLKEVGYKYVMTRCADERGIDVALLYQPGSFRLLSTYSQVIPPALTNHRPTRDILHVSGRVLSGDTLDIFLCHQPSRAGGQRQSEPSRLQVAQVIKQMADSILAIREQGRVVIMGDFNDYPQDKSIKKVLGAQAPSKTETIFDERLYNLMDGRAGGTYKYQGEWGILDQIIVSGSLLQKGQSLSTSYDLAHIASFPFLLEEDKKYGGYTPFRTYSGMKYKGGYSDHLPVVVDLLLKDSIAIPVHRSASR